MIKDNIDIVRELIESLDINLKALSIVQDGDKFDVKVCNVLHLNICSKITFAGVVYKVTNVICI